MTQNRTDVAAIVARMPDADAPGQTSMFTGPNPEDAEKAFREIAGGGREALADLIARVHGTGTPEFKDFRPLYVLHGLALQAGRPDGEDLRKALEAELAGRIADPAVPKGTKALLVQELEVIGSAGAAGALGTLLADEELCAPASRALLSIGTPAASAFSAALPTAKGRCAVSIIQALGALRHGTALEDLKKAAGDTDRDVRTAAVWALASIGAPEAVDTVRKATAAEDGWERTKAVKACLILAERLAAAGETDAAKEVYGHLKDRPWDPKEEYIREAAVRGLKALTD